MKSRMVLFLLLSATVFASIDHKSARATLMRRDIAEIATPNKPRTSHPQRCNLSQSPASHSSSSTTSSTAVILENYLTASAIDEVNRCNRPTAVTRFASTTAKVWIWFDISSGATGDRARTEWYDPDGNFYYQTGWSALPGPGSWCFPDFMPLAGTAAISKTGRWTIRVYYNESFFFSLNFYLGVAKLEQQTISRFLGNGNQCTAPDPASIFLTTDQQVWTWFSVSNALPGDTAYAEWYEPSGSLYTTYRWGPPGITWTDNGCFWSSLGIANSAVAAKPGNWQVKVFYNNASLYSAAFSIVPPTNAGPVIIDGTDGNDHGSVSGGVNQDGWLYMQKALESLSRQVPANVKKTVAALGAVGKAGDAINSAFNLSSLPGNGWSLVHVDGEASVNQWLANLSTANTGILYITTFNLVDGDLSASELAAINSRAAEIARYVNGTSTQNRGGGLFAMGESNLDNNAGAWQWLRLLFPGINVVSYGGDGIDNGIALTGDGMAVLAGLSSSTMANVKPWHNSFSSISERLKVLGTSTDTSGFTRQIILGGSGGDTFLSLCDLTATATAPSTAQTTAPVTFSATSTTAGCNNSVNMTWRRSAAWTGSQSGPRDGTGRAWTDPNFDDGTWTVTGLPDGSPSDSALPNDRYYRAHFNWNGSSTARLSFVSDDGLAIYVNGSLLGSWGSGYRQPGCVNNASICSINTNVPTQTIPASMLRTGENVIAIDLWNTQQGFYLDTTLTGGAALPVYEWDFGDNTPHASGASVQHNYATAGTFTWKLTVSLAGAVTSVKTGTITVQGNCTPPSIAVQPVSQTISNGQSVTLSVVAQGSAPLSYQWYRGQSGDPNSVLIAGATNSSFTTPALSSTTSYWGRVSNNCGGGSRADSATATINVIAPIQMEIADPACRTALDCPGTYLEDRGAGGVTLTRNLSRLAEANVTRDGATADGVSRLLLRVTSDVQIRFSLKLLNGAPADARWGMLSTYTGAGTGSSVLVMPEAVQGRGKIAFAVYQSPLDFPGDDGTNSAGLTIEAIATVDGRDLSTVKQSIALLRPPLVLMHGVWSDSSAWEDLEKYLSTRGFSICDGCRPDYGNVEDGKYKAGSFDPATATTAEDKFIIEQLIKATDNALQAYRTPDPINPGPSHPGYAVTQVDIVGHSMGGLVARARASQKYAGVHYLRKANYNQGDFHKLITVGTPHFGSPLADWLIEHKCDTLTLGRNDTIENKFNGGIYYIIGPMRIGPAIYGFQTASIALKNIGPTSVPTHAIAGIASDTTKTEFFLNRVFTNSGTNAPDFDNNKNFSIDGLLGGDGAHDTIVATTSQSAGLPDKAISSVQDVVHANKVNTGETGSEEVWRMVVQFLRARIADSFAMIETVNSDGSSRQMPDSCPRSMQLAALNVNVAEQSANATVTLTPAPGTIVRPGSNIQINFSISGGNPVNGAVIATDDQAQAIDGPGPFSVSVPAPANRAGRFAIAAATYGRGPDNYEATTYVVVTPQGTLASLTAAPKRLRFERSGERYQLRVNGLMSDGTQIDLTAREAGTTYAAQSGNNRVISVNVDGLLEARGSGQETIIVTNAGKTTTVAVTVELTNPAPSVASLTPSSVIAGGNGFTLSVNGGNFNSDSTIYWDGVPRPTTFVSISQVTAPVAATDIAIAKSVHITVLNPSPGGGIATANMAITASPAAVTTVSAASFTSASLAAESIVAAFGTALATSVQIASSLPLPTSLAGTTVNVKDSAGVERLAPLFFVAPSQINYQIPPSTANGTATVTVTSGDGAVSVGAVQIASVAPGLFTVNSSGQGLAAAVALRVRADGSLSYEPVARFDPALNRIVAVPIDLGPATDQVFLILYGTGWRSRSNLSAVTVKIGGADAETLFAGPTDGFVGLDQLNVRVPRSLAGRGEIGIALTVDGKVANTVSVNVR